MTPVAWDGEVPTARPAGEIFRRLIRRKKFYEKGKFGPLCAAWARVVGEGVAERTSLKSYREGRLLVEVDSPVLLQELSGFMTRSLLEELRRTPEGRDVAEVRFCLRGSRAGASRSGPRTGARG